MKFKAFALACVCATVFLSGCQTERVQTVKLRGPFDPIDETDAPKVTREKTFIDRVEKDPKDVQGWFELGDYYERGEQLVQAREAYARGTALLEPNRYTGGHYLLAKVSVRLQDWQHALGNLQVIFSLEPKDPKSACLNPHFREAHYLQGVIFFIHKQYRSAKKEFLRYLDLGGEEWRVEDSLGEIQAQGD
ncbi:MAG: tetratricopeptide repeat protein [Planctomycetota bacterium]